jgi:Protein of unknown function (DUF4232)
MNDLERRLSDLLHTGAPDPERIITASEIAGLAQDGRTPNGRVTQRWGVPLLAAAAVLVAVAVPAVVIGRNSNSATPTSHSSGGPTPAPTTASAPAPTSSGTSSPSSTTSITSGSVACLTSQLSLTPGLTNGAAGSLYTSFVFTNTAGTPCSMRGFPGVSLLNDAGAIVGQPATRDGSTGPSVRLGAGQRAQFILHVGTATRTGCTIPIPSSRIEVYPPEQTVPLRIPFSTASCSVSVQSVIAAK